VRPLRFVAWAKRNGELIHSAAIGAPDDKRKIDGCWNGHLVVTVAGFLTDPTIYQIKRPAWRQLAGTMALPIHGRPWEPSRFWWRPS
jgi:hypothetical protein